MSPVVSGGKQPKRKSASTKESAKTARSIGPASKYIEQFRASPGDRFIIFGRVFSSEKNCQSSIKGQELKLPKLVKEHDGLVLDVLLYMGSEKEWTWERFLREAARLARMHGATLLAAAADRFYRSPLSSGPRKDGSQAQPSAADLQELVKITRGVTLMTYLPPDASMDESKALLEEWGEETQGKKGGRLRHHPRKYIREKWLPFVVELHESGKSIATIERMLNQKAGCNVISHMTLVSWVRKYSKRSSKR